MIKFAYIIDGEISSLKYKEVFDFIKTKYRNIFDMIKIVYPERLANQIIYNLKLINNVHTILYNKGDFAGLSTDVKESFYEESNFNKSM
jgi:hypothetical protein